MSGEQKESFAKWTSGEVVATDGDDGARVNARFCIGIVVNARGVSVQAEGVAGSGFIAGLSVAEECALYEALRVRFDSAHREAIQRAALTKLSPLEQDVLRQAWAPVAVDPSGEKPPKRNARPAR